MKELSIEEKAKAYDEAMKRIENIKTGKCETTFMFTEGLFEHIFPELKESEDERIRKELIKLFKTENFNGYVTLNGIDIEDVLAWLEKHEEDTYDYKRVDLDKFDERIQEFSDMLEDKPKPYWDGWYEAMEWIRTHGNPFKKQGEQKSLDDIAKEVTKDKDAAISFLKSTGIINENGELADEYKIEQDEQNSAWSEEDEDYYDAIIAKLEVTQDNALLTDNQMKFLKSLKDRYTWKPSNEQMEGLECIIKTLRYQLNDGDNRLDSLYNDLKKLRDK